MGATSSVAAVSDTDSGSDLEVEGGQEESEPGEGQQEEEGMPGPGVEGGCRVLREAAVGCFLVATAQLIGAPVSHTHRGDRCHWSHRTRTGDSRTQLSPRSSVLCYLFVLLSGGSCASVGSLYYVLRSGRDLSTPLEGS